MDSIYKINSVQSDPFTATQNLLDFVIPSGQVLDLSESHINLVAQVSGSNSTFADTQAVYNVSVNCKDGNANASAQVPTVALVKHARIRSKAVPNSVEELRDVNIYRCNQQAFLEDDDDRKGGNLSKLMSAQGSGGIGFGNISPMINCDSGDPSGVLGSTANYAEREIRIPLKDIFNVANEPFYDTGRLGETSINLELDLTRANTCASDNYRQSYFIGGGGANESKGAVDDNATAGAVTTVRLTKTFLAQSWRRECGFYINGAVKFSAGTIATSGAAIDLTQVASIRRITGLAYDNATGKITVTLSATLGTAAGAGIQNAIITPLEADVSAVTYKRAELVLRQKNNVPREQIPAPMRFRTFHTERDAGGAGTSHKRQYDFEPNAVGMMWCGLRFTDDLYSQAEMSSYRISVNNELTTNRDVSLRTPVYYDRASRYFTNSGKVIKSLTLARLSRTGTNDSGQVSDPNLNDFQMMKPIFETLPLTKDLKLVEVDITASAGQLQNLVFFTDVVKEV
tara:strand:+ start:589 stop:2127 length:1539 start_codon:yes stop_codon:yes gene_type:complete